MLKKLIMPGMIAITLLGSLAFSGYSYISSGNLRSQIAAQESQMKELNAQLTEFEMQKTDPEEVAVVLNTATKAGNEIVALQNYYANVISDGSMDAFSDVSKRADVARDFFSESDENAVVPWYDGSQDSYVWSFETTYSFLGNKVPVVWLCRSKSSDHDLLAYATADYNVKEDYFENVAWKSVSRGQSTNDYSLGLPKDIDRDSIWQALIGEMPEEEDEEETPNESSSMLEEPTPNPDFPQPDREPDDLPPPGGPDSGGVSE